MQFIIIDVKPMFVLDLRLAVGSLAFFYPSCGSGVCPFTLTGRPWEKNPRIIVFRAANIIDLRTSRLIMVCRGEIFELWRCRNDSGCCDQILLSRELLVVDFYGTVFGASSLKRIPPVPLESRGDLAKRLIS